MTLLSFLAYAPAIVLGTLIVHLFWPQKFPSSVLIKASLGTGLGLGLSSILYFITLQAAPGRINMIVLQIIIIILLGVIGYFGRGMPGISPIRIPSLTWGQWGWLCLFVISLALSAFVFTRYVIARPQGALDAWSIWNRAARFIHRDPENWSATLSPDLPLLRHADYPLLIPLNVAWGWDVVGNESLRTPMMQGFLFTFSAIFLLFSAIALTRTIGQASLASIVLIAMSGIVPTGTTLIADVPLAYFILASAILMYLFTLGNDYPLLALSGFMAGLCGWTKNEGLIFIAVSAFALMIASPSNFKKALAYYLAGLFLPLAVIGYFKLLAPPNDLMASSDGGLFEKLLDFSRYEMIVRSFGTDFFKPQAIFLFIYFLIMGSGVYQAQRRGFLVLSALLALQVLGYGFVYLITPYDLSWHLMTSQARLLFQIIPLAVFICFGFSMEPEKIFPLEKNKNG